MPGVRYTVIETEDDEVVTPYTSAFLSGPAVTNVTLQDQCPDDHADHLAMPYDSAALQDVVQALDGASVVLGRLRPRPPRARRLTCRLPAQRGFQLARPQGPVPDEFSRRDSGDESFWPVVSGRRELAVRDSAEQGNCSALLDTSDPLDHDVGAESFERDVGLNGQRDPRIAPNVAQLHVVGQVAGDDLVPVPPDVDARHLRGAVRADGGQMDEPPRRDGRPGGLVESDGVVCHGVSSVVPSVLSVLN